MRKQGGDHFGAREEKSKLFPPLLKSLLLTFLTAPGEGVPRRGFSVANTEISLCQLGLCLAAGNRNVCTIA